VPGEVKWAPEGAEMERRYIGELKLGENIEEVFLVREKFFRTARTGSDYIQMELVDRTGSITARMWDASRAIFDAFQANDFVQVRARVDSYQDRLQLIVSSLRTVPEEQVDVSDFLPKISRDVDQLFTRIKEISAQITNSHLKRLLELFLTDADFAEKFRRAPAAIAYHQPFLGGLIEHTTNVCELALPVLKLYPQLSKDLLLAAAILHDIGKVRELEYTRTLDYTDEGKLIGHVVLGVLMVEEKVREISDFPGELLTLLRHLLLSHHGEYEWGSPKLPMTPEALALHHLDNLDAKVEASSRAIREDADRESLWTEYSRMFQRRFYKGQAKEDED